MRKNGGNTNALMESMHLRKYMEDMYKLENKATKATLQDKAAMASQRATFRSTQLTSLENSRRDKLKKLEHDDAVHAALLKHKVSVLGVGARVRAEPGRRRGGVQTCGGGCGARIQIKTPASCPLLSPSFFLRVTWSVRSCAWSWP